MWGTTSPKLSHLTKDLWLWCMERNILLQAQHLTRVLNSIANRESRIWSDRSEWKLSPDLIQNINHKLGPLSTDLLASRLSAQLPAFISWKLDPLAIATDVFTVDWSTIPANPYANSPWSLVGRVLSQILDQKVHELILVAPVWKAQSWYPLLLQMLVREPLLIPQSPKAIQLVRMPEQPSRHHTSVSCVSCPKERCQSSLLSEAATDLVVSSWRQKSSKSYNSSFNKWACWYEERDRNLISGAISDVANFLAEQGYQYSSINVYRSSISTTHERMEGYPVCKHPTVVRLMKGVFKKRPPQPKYTHTWTDHSVCPGFTIVIDNIL